MMKNALRAALAMTLALSMSGCFSPSYKSGDLQCSPNGSCPPGYHCAANRCYRNDDGPDLGTASSGKGDLGAFDLGSRDLGGAADLSQPPPIVVPPAAVFVSAGGGSSTAASGATLNMSIPGIVLGGTSTATSGASVSFGYFSNASVE
jgi:hypothetical protein